MHCCRVLRGCGVLARLHGRVRQWVRVHLLVHAVTCSVLAGWVLLCSGQGALAVL